jgi:hypothetical protein
MPGIKRLILNTVVGKFDRLRAWQAVWENRRQM